MNSQLLGINNDRIVLVIGICNFEIVFNLSIVIWDFSAVSGKANQALSESVRVNLDESPGHFKRPAGICQNVGLAM